MQLFNHASWTLKTKSVKRWNSYYMFITNMPTYKRGCSSSQQTQGLREVLGAAATHNHLLCAWRTEHGILFAAAFCASEVFNISSPPPPSTYASHYQSLSITAITGTHTIWFLGKRPTLMLYLSLKNMVQKEARKGKTTCSTRQLWEVLHISLAFLGRKGAALPQVLSPL